MVDMLPGEAGKFYCLMLAKAGTYLLPAANKSFRMIIRIPLTIFA